MPKKPFKYVVREGDTANSISNKFGFRNYRESGFSVPKSGNFDQIAIGEEINLENYDPSTVKTSPTSTPTVLGSQDNTVQNNDNQDFIKQRDTSIDPNLQQDPQQDKPTDIPPPVETKPVDTQPPKEINGISDPTYIKSRQDDEGKRETAKLKMESDKADFLSSLDTRLAQNSEALRIRLTNISQIWDKRIKVQDRLNSLRVNRIKAYGVSRGAIYQPIQFTDAVTAREEEASSKIQELESLRGQALSEAKLAYESGKSMLLQSKVDNIKSIEADLEAKYTEIERESDKQYKLLLSIEKEQQKEDEKLREETLKKIIASVQMRKEEFQDMTPEEIDQEVQKLVVENNIQYSDAYNAIMEGKSINLKEEDLRAKIEKTKATTEKTKEQTLTEEEKRKTEKAKQYKYYKDTAKKDKPTAEEMSADIPETFRSKADAEAKRQEFIRKYGVAGAKQWDSVFEKIDEFGKKVPNYPIGSKAKSEDKDEEYNQTLKKYGW